MSGQATFTITVPWWAYGAFCAGVLGLIAAGYAAGRLDRRDARATAAISKEFAPTIRRWRALDQARGRISTVGEQGQAVVEGATAWPVNRTKPGWAAVVEAWGQTRHRAAYPKPPALTPQPDPRVAEPTVGRAPVTAVEPLTWWEENSAINAALGGRVRWAADAEETGWIPAVRA